MRILLAVDTRNDPRVAAAYVAERFGSAPLAVDVLTVVPPAAATGAAAATADPRAATTVVSEVAERLREMARTSRVETHVEAGRDPAAVIAAAAERLGSEIVLVETAPRGLFARLRAASVSRSLVHEAPCAVELIKPYVAAPRSLFNVLVPIDGERLADFPLHRLAGMPWPAGTRLRLLGTMPPAALDLPFETNAFRVFDSVAREHAAASRAGAELRDMAVELAAALDGQVEVDHEVIEAAGCAAVLAAAERARASLVVTCATSGERSASGARGLALRVALGAPCPVLVLRREPGPARRPLAGIRAFAPSLVRA